MPTARVLLTADDAALLLDLPEDVVVDGDVELVLVGASVPDGPARLRYELDEYEVPSLIAIEPVQQDG